MTEGVEHILQDIVSLSYLYNTLSPEQIKLQLNSISENAMVELLREGTSVNEEDQDEGNEE